MGGHDLNGPEVIGTNQNGLNLAGTGRNCPELRHIQTDSHPPF